MRIAHVFPVLVFAVVALCGAEPTDRVHESFAAASDVSIRIENVSGRILVRPSNGNTVDITAVKRALDPDALANIRIEISKDGDPVTSVSVRTRFEHHANKAESVEYTVTAPRRAKLRLSNVSGDVTADGFSSDVRVNTVSGDVHVTDTDGNIKINTVNGSIIASLLHMGDSRSAALHTVNGSIDLSVPKNSSASVRANSIAGKFHSDFPLTATSQIVGTQVRGSIGDGSGSIDLASVDGSLTLSSQR